MMPTKKHDKLNGSQRRAIKAWENLSSFEFMYIHNINLGRMTFREAWDANNSWVDGLLGDLENLSLDGCGFDV